MNVLGLLRSTYLYTALSIAGGATVVALVGLLGVALQLAGLSPTPPLPESVRETVSSAIATLIFAVPIGAIHLWLVRRSLVDPNERGSGPRHFFLNAWIVMGLVMAVMSIDTIARLLIVDGTNDLAFPIASVFGALLVTMVGWRWREWYPGARRDWQVVAAFATLFIATVLAVMHIVPVVGALVDIVVPEGAQGFYPAREEAWSSLVGVVTGLSMWSLGLRWLWRWRNVRFRTYYAAAAYFVGIALIALPGSDALARLIGILRGGVQAVELRGVLEAPAIGAVLIAMHLPWLLADRGLAGYHERVTDRIVRGITALGGLAALTLTATSWGSVLVQDIFRIGPPQPDPLRVRDQAVATLAIGLALYPVPWWSFLRSTAGDPRSGLRRAYVLFVVGAAVLGAIVAGVVAAGNVIQIAMGLLPSASVIRDTVDAAGWTAVFAVVLAAHVWLLLHDIRAARAVAPTGATPEVDPMVGILEDVAAGRVAPREAAGRIRALRSPLHLPGLP